MRFATKIGLTVAAVTLLAAPLVGVAVFYQASVILQERIVHEQVESAKSVMRAIDNALYQAYLDVTMIASDDLLRTYVENPARDARKNQAEGELEEREELTGPWSVLQVFDSSGHARFGPKPLGESQDISSYPANHIAFKRALKGEIYYSDQIRCPNTGRPLVIFAAPVYGRANPNKVVGVVIAQYQWVAVQQILDHVDSAAVVHLLNQKGKVIGQRSGDTVADEAAVAERKAVLARGEATSYFVESTLHGGGESLVVELSEGGFKDYRGSGWRLLIEQPLETAFAPIAHMARVIALLTLALLLLLGGLLYVLVRRFLQPLDDLLQGVRSLAGGSFDKKLAVRSVDEFGELAESFNVMVDKLREAQEVLVHKEKQAMLGQVAASVGNELRNPLGVMSNAVYFLQTMLEGSEDNVKEYLDIIRNEITRSERIAVALMEAVQIPSPDSATYAVAQLIGQILRECSIPSNITVRVDIPEMVPAVRVDAIHMKHIFGNLISNAVDAMPEGGVLEILARANAQAKAVVISVRDTGSGISPEDRVRLFQPLFTTKARGIGLGLLVAKNMVEANGGTIEVESEVGKGTVFSIALPMANEKENEHV